MDLKAIYLKALARCAPDVLVQEHVTASMPKNVVAIGKCAGALLDGVAAVHEVESAFVALPEGYPLPRFCHPEPRRRPKDPPLGARCGDPSAVFAAQDDRSIDIHIGGHPHMTRASFDAGRALMAFVEAHDDILFLISGGGSACVEVPLPPHTEEELIETNARLIASGAPIAAINAERKRLSAIKGGKLRARGNSVALVYSDVATHRLHDVASGPVNGPLICIADNSTLVNAAADIIGARAHRIEQQIECDVEDAARMLASAATKEKIVVAGGEPTVRVAGVGRGGRCSELAVRFARISADEALFAASDGVDGNSGAAGIHLPPREQPCDDASWDELLERSDSFRIAAQIGEPIMIAATGSNLRDLFLVARD